MKPYVLNGVQVIQKRYGGTTSDPILLAGPLLAPGDFAYDRSGSSTPVKDDPTPRFMITMAYGSPNRALVFDQSRKPGHDNPHPTEPSKHHATLWISELLAAEAVASTVAASSVALLPQGATENGVPAVPASAPGATTAGAPTKDRHLADVVLSRDPGGGPRGSVWSLSDGNVYARWEPAGRKKKPTEVEVTLPSLEAVRNQLPGTYYLIVHEVARGC